MQIDYSQYLIKPFVIDAKKAHREKIVTYSKNGSLALHYESTHLKINRIISKKHQFSLIRPTFDDLNKALSSTANSPLSSSKKTLREEFSKVLATYESLVKASSAAGEWEPDYGTYVYDPVTENIYLIAPEKWHRLSLVVSTSKLLTDLKATLSWRDIRERFDNVVIGIVGASVGGNVLEGIMREIRPKTIKIADPDWIELSNLNRLERGSLRTLVGSRAQKLDAKNPYELVRMNKAEVAAYEHNLVDPYAQIYVYKDGIYTDNIDQFLLGNKSHEPKIDILVEECDDLRLKVSLRKACRTYGIPVLMMSDFGHIVQGQFQDYKKNPQAGLGYTTSDATIESLLNTLMSSGKREDRFAFIEALCGSAFKTDEFGVWVEGKGEQPTSSLPQSGATAMVSGGIGAKVLALYLLGHHIPERFIYNTRSFEVTTG